MKRSSIGAMISAGDVPRSGMKFVQGGDLDVRE